MIEKSNTSSFSYPERKIGWFWIAPWEYSGAIKNYFYSNTSFINKDNKSSITARRVFGFTQVTTKWLCDPLEAFYLYKQGMDRLLKVLKEDIYSVNASFDKKGKIKTSIEKFSVDSAEGQVELNNRECCGRDCGCH